MIDCECRHAELFSHDRNEIFIRNMSQVRQELAKPSAALRTADLLEVKRFAQLRDGNKTILKQKISEPPAVLPQLSGGAEHGKKPLFHTLRQPVHHQPGIVQDD